MNSETRLIIIILAIAIAIIIAFINRKKEIKKAQQYRKIPETVPEILDESIEKIKHMPYRKKHLLTKNEWYFYKNLKEAADDIGLSVLAKIRVADLVEVTAKDRSEWQTYFNKINKKHIDFALAKPENLQIELLIELDDSTHNELQKERDHFINDLYAQTGYKLLRVRDSKNIREKIQCTLEPDFDQEKSSIQNDKSHKIAASEVEARAQETTEAIIVSEIEIITND